MPFFLQTPNSMDKQRNTGEKKKEIEPII